jgi:hypothetical protein
VKASRRTPSQLVAYQQAGHAIAAFIARRPQVRIGLAAADQFLDRSVDSLLAVRVRPPTGGYVPAHARTEAEDVACVQIGGVVAVLKATGREPAGRDEPDAAAHPGWATAKKLVNLHVPDSHNGEGFHARMQLYRRMSRCLGQPRYWGAFVALVEQLLRRGVLEPGEIESVIYQGMDRPQNQPRWPYKPPVPAAAALGPESPTYQFIPLAPGPGGVPPASVFES